MHSQSGKHQVQRRLPPPSRPFSPAAISHQRQSTRYLAGTAESSFSMVSRYSGTTEAYHIAQEWQLPVVKPNYLLVIYR